jgi:hypothetical protein
MRRGLVEREFDELSESIGMQAWDLSTGSHGTGNCAPLEAGKAQIFVSSALNI